MTRVAFWDHLLKIYQEVYPDPSSPSGSILTFGIVATEQHRGAAHEGHRHEHKHAATFSTKQHYWNRIAKLSAEKYNIHLNAVAHDSYATMYAYLRRPTAKKPLTELDAEPHLSGMHPRGHDLARLLEASKHSERALNGREASKRKRFSVFEEIASNKLRSVADLRTFAATEAIAGRPKLAEFCTRQGPKLESLLENAWAVVDAPSQPRNPLSLLEKLRSVYESSNCKCAGEWTRGAYEVLKRNEISHVHFQQAVYRALQLGAVREVNVACVGPGGCGKSTLLESLEEIFSCAPKVEHESTFPLGSMLGFDLMLWQDYEHDEKTLRFSDLLSWFVGEGVGVRIPGQLNKKIRNRAPCFYSGRIPLHLLPGPKRTPEAAAALNSMMLERFTTFYFTSPIPKGSRVVGWKQCGKCAAGFFLAGEPNAANTGGGANASVPQQGAMPAQAQVPPHDNLVLALAELARLHACGALDNQEFQVAKRRLLG